jgi:hypothetical protein
MSHIFGGMGASDWSTICKFMQKSHANVSTN